MGALFVERWTLEEPSSTPGCVLTECTQHFTVLSQDRKLLVKTQHASTWVRVWKHLNVSRCLCESRTWVYDCCWSLLVGFWSIVNQRSWWQTAQNVYIWVELSSTQIYTLHAGKEGVGLQIYPAVSAAEGSSQTGCSCAPVRLDPVCERSCRWGRRPVVLFSTSAAWPAETALPTSLRGTQRRRAHEATAAVVVLPNEEPRRITRNFAKL